MNLGTAQVIQGNALALPLPDNSVDLICTSPPYFGLRSYQDAGTHYEGQIGSEATPAEFLDALLAATREMVRVLKPSGSLFINLGDKYSGGRNGPQGETGQRNDRAQAITYGKNVRDIQTDIPGKSLMGIPWRYAIACIDQLGLILRAEIIWSKPNGLPESVTDRVRRNHEQWFHFVRQPRYFSAVDEIREPQMHPNGTQGPGFTARKRSEVGYAAPTYQYDAPNPLGKLPGSVWTIPTQPLTVPPELGVDHFAAYPMEFPRRIIQGWTPNGICTQCDEGRRPAKDVDWSKVPHQMVLKRILTDAQITRWVSQFRVICDNHNITARAINEALGTATNGSGRGGAFTGRAGHWEIPTPEMWERMNAALGPFPVELEELVYATQLVPVSLIDSGNDTATTGRHQTDGHRRMSSAEYRTITGYMCACTPYTDHPERRGKDFLAGADRTKAGRSANSSERNRAYREGTSGPSGPIHEYHLEDWTPAPTTPAVVLDPFGGTGTTALVAKALGRIGITIDLSADYCRLAEWRVNDPRELAAALQVEKPEPIHPDQLDLFSESP